MFAYLAAGLQGDPPATAISGCAAAEAKSEAGTN